MNDVAQACADLAAWYPAIRALTTQPDTSTVTGRHQPCSRPPWNSAAANAWTDIHAGARELERDLRYQVTGTLLERGGSDQNTLEAISAVARLSEAAGDDQVTLRLVDRWIIAAEQLPAIDLSEPARKLAGVICERCDREMVAAWPRSGRVACYGCRAKGVIVPGTVSDGYVAWDDGTVT